MLQRPQQQSESQNKRNAEYPAKQDQVSATLASSNRTSENQNMSLQSSHLSLLGLEDSSPLSPRRNGTGSEGSDSLNSSNSGNGHVHQAGCPYALALQLDASRGLPPSLPGVIELKECPAFANQQCPFKGAKSPDEISQKLAQIPPSHLDSQGVFMKTLAFYHREATSPVAISTGGGCPVKALLPKDFSFDRALEEYSLAAIMSKLAKKHESSQPKSDDDVGLDDEDDASAANSEAAALDDELSEVQSMVSVDETQTTVESAIPPSSSDSAASLESPEQYQASAVTKQQTTLSSNGGPRRLSDALKSGTAQAHEAAESVHFVKNFIRGIIDRDLYGLLVAQLFHVYRRLEAALEDNAPTYFAPCHFPTELNRTASLQEDVDFWHTTTMPPVSAATQDYLDRIDHLAREDPLLLLAHAYTRYLGDLSGGKILARVAKRALKLDKNGEGLAFYHFDHITSFKKFKDQYRASLNRLPLGDTQIQALVQEANVAFLLNMRLFEELDVLGGVPDATVRPLQEVYRIAHEAASNRTSNMPQQQTAPCPFANGGIAAGGHSDAAHTTGKTCPWPFILLHDPKAGMRRWQTWLVIGLFLAYCYQQVNSTVATSNGIAVGKSRNVSLPPIKTKSKLQKKNSSSAKAFRRAISHSQIYQAWKVDTDSSD